MSRPKYHPAGAQQTRQNTASDAAANRIGERIMKDAGSGIVDQSFLSRCTLTTLGTDSAYNCNLYLVRCVAATRPDSRETRTERNFPRLLPPHADDRFGLDCVGVEFGRSHSGDRVKRFIAKKETFAKSRS